MVSGLATAHTDQLTLISLDFYNQNVSLNPGRTAVNIVRGIRCGEDDVWDVEETSVEVNY